MSTEPGRSLDATDRAARLIAQCARRDLGLEGADPPRFGNEHPAAGR
ncbi:hypothetical protein [Actinocorallia longicatena]